MNLVYNTDINSDQFGLCDLSFTEGNTLTSAVLISLFSWRRVSQDELEDGTKLYGTWYDTSERKLGSKLWLLQRRSITPSLIPLIKQYIQEALQWLVEDGICSSIDVLVSQNPFEPNAVQAQVYINKNDGTQQTHTFSDLWAAISL